MSFDSRLLAVADFLLALGLVPVELGQGFKPSASGPLSLSAVPSLRSSRAISTSQESSESFEAVSGTLPHLARSSFKRSSRSSSGRAFLRIRGDGEGLLSFKASPKTASQDHRIRSRRWSLPATPCLPRAAQRGLR